MRFRPVGFPAALLLFSGSILLTRCGAPGSASALPVPYLEDLNVVLIVVDTLRADALGAYDPSVKNTPALDQFAGQAVVFERAYSPAPWTQPAVASLMTGMMPSTHDVRQIMDVLTARQMTMAEVLHARGYKTHGIASNPLIKPELGYAQGYDSYQMIGDPGLRSHLQITAHDVSSQALIWLAENRTEPYFLMVHYFDPHYSYQHHPRYSLTDDYGGELKAGMEIRDLRARSRQMSPGDIEYLHNLYREEVAFTDFQIGRLLRHFERPDRSRKTLIVVTADHGEEFMSHGWLGHTRSLFEEHVRVPLMMRLTGTLVPRSIPQPVSLVDVFPTLLSFSRMPMPNVRFDGVSLRDLLLYDRPLAREQVLAEVSFLPPSGHDPAKRGFFTALIGDGSKVIHDLDQDRWIAFDLGQDPGEKENLWGDGLKWADQQQRLLAWEQGNAGKWETDRAPRDLDPVLLRRLRSLGYVQ